MEYLVLALHNVDYYQYWPWYASGSLLFGIIGWLLGAGKGIGCAGFLLGCVLGPVGLLIVFLWKGRA